MEREGRRKTTVDNKDPTIDNGEKVQPEFTQVKVPHFSDDDSYMFHGYGLLQNKKNKTTRPSLRVPRIGGWCSAAPYFAFVKWGFSSFDTVNPVNDSTWNRSFSFSSQIIFLRSEGSCKLFSFI